MEELTSIDRHTSFVDVGSMKAGWENIVNSKSKDHPAGHQQAQHQIACYQKTLQKPGPSFAKALASFRTHAAKTLLAHNEGQGPLASPWLNKASLRESWQHG